MASNATNTPVETADCTKCGCEVPETAMCPECGLCFEGCCKCQPAQQVEEEETFEPRRWRHERPYFDISRRF